MGVAIRQPCIVDASIELGMHCVNVPIIRVS